jgi:hypothetical protein
VQDRGISFKALIAVRSLRSRVTDEIQKNQGLTHVGRRRVDTRMTESRFAVLAIRLRGRPSPVHAPKSSVKAYFERASEAGEEKRHAVAAGCTGTIISRDMLWTFKISVCQQAV